ncbi:MAG: hypothetical protein ACON4U_13635 [Myxococcota bacterium]
MPKPSYYYFGSNDTLRLLCESTLECGPICATHNQHALIAIAQQHLPQFIIVDFSELGENTIKLLVKLRQVLPAASVPLVIIADLDLLEPTQQEALFQFPHSLTIAPQHLTDDLKWQLDMTLEGHSLDRTDNVAHPYALEILARIWRLELSGQLERIDTQKRIEICKGGLVSSTGINHIKAGLYGEGFRFYPSNKLGLGDWISIGKILWTAAQNRTTVGFLKNRMYLSITLAPNSGRLTAIDLPLNLRALISEKSNHPLKHQFKVHGLRPTQMEQNLESLFMLGLIQFRNFSPPENNEHQNQAPNPLVPDEAEKLHQELSYLQNLNDWEILGISPTLNLSLIRYHTVKRKKSHQQYLQPGYQVQDRRTIFQILQRIDTACASIISLVKTYRSFGVSELPTDEASGYFQEGHRALFRRDFRTAHNCFEEATNLNPSSGMMLALAAWSAVHVGQYSLALERIEKAQTLLPVHPFVERCKDKISKQLRSNLCA